MLCCTDLHDFISTIDEKTKEDLQHSFSDNSRRLIQTQSVYLGDHVRVDTSDQPDADDDYKQSYSACDAEMHVDTGEHRFTCTVCTKKFKYATTQKRHMRIHSGEQPFSCKVCEKKFTRSSSLRNHMRIHSGERPFSCKFCGKKFTHSSGLRQHMHFHSGERPFTCKVCEKKFMTSSHLINHMRIHSGERAFTCKVCAKKFTDSCNLRQHMRIHSGEQPGNSSRGRSQGAPKFFRPPTYKAHCAVFAIAQLSHEVPH